MSGNAERGIRNVTEVRAFRNLDTKAMFTGAAPDDALSPIDQFISNTQAINRIYLRAAYDAPASTGPASAPTDGFAPADPPTPTQRDAAHAAQSEEDAPAVRSTTDDEPDGGDGAADESIRLTSAPERIAPELGALAVLGYMSAVESYFRALIRKLIDVDDHVRSLVEPMVVSYGAACHHSPAMLPEALMEHLSFAGEKTVIDVLRSLLGIKGNLPTDVDAVMKEFGKACEIRHCCVHRFGRLGSKSAMTLGIRDHRDLLELPFAPSVDDLQGVAALLHTFVKTLNNFVFRSLMERIDRGQGRNAEFAYDWTWFGRWEDDEAKFRRYYDIFASTLDTPPSPALAAMYASLSGMVGEQRSRRGTRARAAPAAAVEAAVESRRVDG